MNVQFKHTIVRQDDQHKPADFLAKILGLSDPSQLGSMLLVHAPNEGAGSSLHYAFVVSEEEFDQVLAHTRDEGLEYCAARGKQDQAGVCHHKGGRAIYIEAPDGHLLEVMTQAGSEA
ncbi:VOC family protein [Pseudoduganella sp. HUAS MS19]